MQIAQVLAGYTLGGADLLRRAMGKKIQSEMDAQRQQFVEGAKARGVEPARAEHDLRPDGEIRRLRLQQIACRRLCAGRLPDRLSEGELSGRVHGRVDDPRPRQHRQAEPVPPGIGPARHRAAAARHQPLRRSTFAVETDPKSGKPAIRYALAAVKGVGAQAMRESGRRARPRTGRSRICSISRSGSTPGASTAASSRAWSRPAPSTRSNPNRAQTFAAAELLLRQASRAAEERRGRPGQPVRRRPRRSSRPSCRWSTDWPPVEKLQHEFDAIGFYLSSHPLDAYGKSLERAGILRSADLPAALAANGADPLPARRHRRRPQGAHLGARQPLRLRADVGPERRLRGDRVLRSAGAGARAVRRRPAAGRHRRCAQRGGEPAADRAKDRAARRRRRPRRGGAAGVFRRGAGIDPVEEPVRPRGAAGAAG